MIAKLLIKSEAGPSIMTAFESRGSEFPFQKRMRQRSGPAETKRQATPKLVNRPRDGRSLITSNRGLEEALLVPRSSPPVGHLKESTRLEELTDTLQGGRYKGTIELP